MKLLVPAFLLLALGYLATAEVVESFEGKCANFFFMASPPTGLSGSQYKKICQKKTEADGYQFATLYDTSKRIPVYSAYILQKHAEECKKTRWNIEPQLDDPNGGELMASECSVSNELRGQKQALTEYYVDTDYNRGHLAPILHQNSQQCEDATFTLTNAAPQLHSFNQGQWREAEKKATNILTDRCLNRGFHVYVVTGVVPGNTKINDKVNVPSYFWSSLCCVDNDNVSHFSGAYYGYNDVNSTVYPISMAEMDEKLKKDYGNDGFQVFLNKCEPTPSSNWQPEIYDTGPICIYNPFISGEKICSRTKK